MSARQQRNVQYLLIGDTASLSTGNPSTLGAGEIGIFDAAGTRITSANAVAGMKFFFAVGGTQPLKKSPLIDGSKLKVTKAVAYDQLVNQRDIIGYNGTSGSIEVITDNLYMVDVYLEDYLESSHDGRYIKHLQTESNATSTQADIALALAASGTYNWSREAKNLDGDPFIIFKAISSETGAAFPIGVTADVVKGSKVIQATGGAFAGVVGDYIKLGTVATSAVYRIVAINGTAYTLDRPVGETSGSIAGREFDAATGAAADWGVVLEGTNNDQVVGKFFDSVTRFTTILGGDGFGTTTFTKDAEPYRGVGTIKGVKDLEWFTAGNNGEFFRMGEPTIYNFESKVNTAVGGGGYDFLDVAYEEVTVGSFVPNHSPIRVTLATPASAPGYMTAANDGIRDVVEVIAGLTAGDLDV